MWVDKNERIPCNFVVFKYDVVVEKNNIKKYILYWTQSKTEKWKSVFLCIFYAIISSKITNGPHLVEINDILTHMSSILV